MNLNFITQAQCQSIKEHTWSAFLTFLTGFLIAILPFIQNLDVSHLKAETIFAALVGVLLAGVRAGIKALSALIATWIQKWISSRQS